MTIKNYAKVALSTLAVTSALAAMPALAQKRPPVRTITIPCCNCIGGEGSTTSINTGNTAGSVPYQVSGPGVTNPVAVPVTTNQNAAWTTALSPAGWVQPNSSNGAISHPPGLYNYTVRFVVPKCTIPMKVTVSGKFAADNGAKVFFDTNPNPIATQFPTPFPNGFAPGNEGSFTAVTMTPGTHTLRFEVRNSGGPSGLVVNAAVRTICSKDIVMPLCKTCQPVSAATDVKAVDGVRDAVGVAPQPE
jgi:hypothetical protein